MKQTDSARERRDIYCLEDFGYDPADLTEGCFGRKYIREQTQPQPLNHTIENGLGDRKCIAWGMPVQRPQPLHWKFDSSTPTCDFFEDQDLDDPEDFQDAVANFVFAMERGEFLAWETVVAQEQGLPLTREQESILNELIDLNDSGNDRVLYINGLPRTAEPWYAILNKIVLRLIAEPFRTFGPHLGDRRQAWSHLVECLHNYAGSLSLPPSVESAVEVVPTELRYRLQL